VLKLVESSLLRVEGEEVPRSAERSYTVRVWQEKVTSRRHNKSEWLLVDQQVPMRLGKNLDRIPFCSIGRPILIGVN
jgi:hypothetical protein